MLEKLVKRIGLNSLKMIADEKLVCIDCGATETCRVREDFCITYHCNCGTLITYPANKNREYPIKTYIPTLENEIKKRIDSYEINIKNFEDYRKIYSEVSQDLKLPTEALRLFNRYKKRKEFKERLLNGTFGKKT